MLAQAMLPVGGFRVRAPLCPILARSVMADLRDPGQPHKPELRPRQCPTRRMRKGCRRLRSLGDHKSRPGSLAYAFSGRVVARGQTWRLYGLPARLALTIVSVSPPDPPLGSLPLIALPTRPIVR